MKPLYQKPYKTKFTISVQKPTDNTIKEEEICEQFHNLAPKVFPEKCLYISNINILYLQKPIEWIGHDYVMKKISEIFPTVLFVLEGDGEDKNDLWIEYFKNGQRQFCQGHVVYDEPNADFFV